jgi:hypothetical protein
VQALAQGFEQLDRLCGLAAFDMHVHEGPACCLAQGVEG